MKLLSKTRAFSTLLTYPCAALTGTRAPRSPLPVRGAHPIQSLYDSSVIREERANFVPAKCNQPRRAAQHTIAGAVSERNPSTKPSRNESRNAIIACPLSI
jgi:hypothetical protein